MKSIWFLGVVLGLAWAQSIQVEVKGELAQVEAQALAALKANGLEPDRVLNLGGQIRQITGASFPDYHLVVLKPEAGSLAAASKNPMAAIILPPTVYVHAAKAGVITVGTFDGRLMFRLLGVAGPETDGLTSRLEASLSRLGKPERIAPAAMPDPKGGMMPALLKAFFEQVFRPGFALGYAESGKMPKKLLTGRTARIIITMGMPAFIYRWYFGAHGLKSLKRSILKLSGVGPIKDNLIGMVESMDGAKREQWIEKKRGLDRDET
ncbi:MAG: hypothetical protein C4327_11660 [Meiothermus sp.]